MARARRIKLHTVGLLTVIGIHLAVDLALTRNVWFLDQQMLMVVLAIPLSQLALLTIWATVVATVPLIRFTVPTVGMIACWYLLSLILPWGVGDQATAAWALAMVIQVFTIVVACGGHQLLRYLRTDKESKLTDIGLSNPLKVSLGTLMLWTTFAGVALGFVQFGRQSWHWTAAVFQWHYLGAIPVIGATNGLVAAMCLWVFAADGWSRLFARMVAATLITGGLALFQYYVAAWIIGTVVMTMRDTLIVVAAQSFIISASLAVAKAGLSKLS